MLPRGTSDGHHLLVRLRGKLAFGYTHSFHQSNSRSQQQANTWAKTKNVKFLTFYILDIVHYQSSDLLFLKIYVFSYKRSKKGKSFQIKNQRTPEIEREGTQDKGTTLWRSQVWNRIFLTVRLGRSHLLENRRALNFRAGYLLRWANEQVMGRKK